MPPESRGCFGVVQFPSVIGRLVCVGLVGATAISIMLAFTRGGPDWVVASVVLGMPALFSPMFWNVGGKSRGGELHVAAGALLLEGVPVVPARDIRGASIDAAFRYLRLERRWPLGSVHVFFDSEADLTTIHRALGDKQSPNTIWVGSQLMTRWWLAFLLLCAGFGCGIALAVSFPHLPEWIPLATPLAPAFVLCFWPSRACVSDGELVVRWLGWWRSTPLYEIAEVRRREMGNVHTLFITLRNGDVERIAGLTSDQLIALEAEIALGRDREW